jgi:hypothetical protein
MSASTPTPYTEEELKQRQELFRYTDMTHPLIQALFKLRLEASESNSVVKGS